MLDLDLRNNVDKDETMNTYTRLGDAEQLRSLEEVQEDDNEAILHATRASAEDLEELDPTHRFLHRGDLVELEFPRSEKDSIVAVFVRRLGGGAQSQFYTVQGKWVHVPEKLVQHVVPGYINVGAIDKIIPYLPEVELTEEMSDKAAFYDLSVPREMAAPIVSELLKFQQESEELYRQHASQLDDAHNRLAHEEHLRFGSLEVIAHTLLGTDPKEPLPPTALFTVRKALLRAGFAFEMDRRSHRLTGLLQLRSKEQVRMVNEVVGWLREWQDALAQGITSSAGSAQLSHGAANVFDFIDKAKRTIRLSRTMRDYNSSGSIGPSKTRHVLSLTQDATSNVFGETYTRSDRELIKFVEAWACHAMFFGNPRLESLPPLLLQATGMYDGERLASPTAFMFLQEIGLLLPFENRVRFNTSLLLPSSQHSKPLENLMTKTQVMENDHRFSDSMASLRHDWGSMPVFCIDSEGAHEIDDGISIESAGQGEHWVHIHIANPTAFFDKQSPLARLAQHMRETIYMPERVYVMLPRWAGERHFSLAPNRPCLTFSAKINESGDYSEYKITPGIIRNVRTIPQSAINKLVGRPQQTWSDKVLCVGGTVPTLRSKQVTDEKRVSKAEVQMLKDILRISEKLFEKRSVSGGFYLPRREAQIKVWNRLSGPGLGWDPPSRIRARHVEGDPIIEYRSAELGAASDSSEDASPVLVREMMLLACAIAARWCGERNIPVFFRGSVDKPGSIDLPTFRRDVLDPATAKNGGRTPMHMIATYLRNSGLTAITTKPLHHTVLGMSHYTKATSPLRRFGDMVLHWQIEAALRREAKGHNLIGKNNDAFLPYTTEEIKHLAVSQQPREALIRRAVLNSNLHWTMQTLFRAHHYGECEMPKTLTVYVLSPTAPRQMFVLTVCHEYSFDVAMQRPERFGLGEAKPGDTWEVSISEVEVFLRRVQVIPLRLVDRWED